MPITRAFPDEVTKVDDAAVYDLGTEWSMEAEEVSQLGITGVVGPCVWRYVAISTAVVTGEVVARDTGEPYTGTEAGAVGAVACLGAAQWDIGTGKYGWVLRNGVGLLAAADNGGDQEDEVLATAGSGRVDVMDATEEHQVVGFGLADAATTPGATFQAYISIP